MTSGDDTFSVDHQRGRHRCRLEFSTDETFRVEVLVVGRADVFEKGDDVIAVVANVDSDEGDLAAASLVDYFEVGDLAAARAAPRGP